MLLKYCWNIAVMSMVLSYHCWVIVVLLWNIVSYCWNIMKHCESFCNIWVLFWFGMWNIVETLSLSLWIIVIVVIVIVKHCHCHCLTIVIVAVVIDTCEYFKHCETLWNIVQCQILRWVSHCFFVCADWIGFANYSWGSSWPAGSGSPRAQRGRCSRSTGPTGEWS